MLVIMKKKEVTAETENNWIIAKNSSLSKYNKRKTAELTFLALPALLMIFILRYLPIGGLVMAFQDFRFDTGFFNSKFVGFDNFKFLFSSEDFIRITVNSLAYNLVFILTGTIGSLIIALLLFEVKSKIAIKVYQTAILLPYFLSMVIVRGL